MQRYFINQLINPSENFELNPDDNHHLVRVMRSKVADKIYVVDLSNTAYLCEIIRIDNQTAQLRILQQLEEQEKELPIKVTIACGLSKNDKIDLIVQKGTECGMHQFIPLAMERDVVVWKGNKADSKIERLQRISKEAAEQCHRNVIPKIGNLKNLEHLIAESSDYDYKLIAYEETAKDNKHGQLKQTLSTMKQEESLIIVFGSEGGISPSEVEKLKEVGYIECSLGPRILRAETAPIYALSAISYQFEG